MDSEALDKIRAREAQLQSVREQAALAREREQTEQLKSTCAELQLQLDEARENLASLRTSAQSASKESERCMQWILREVESEKRRTQEALAQVARVKTAAIEAAKNHQTELQSVQSRAETTSTEFETTRTALQVARTEIEALRSQIDANERHFRSEKIELKARIQAIEGFAEDAPEVPDTGLAELQLALERERALAREIKANLRSEIDSITPPKRKLFDRVRRIIQKP